MIEAINKVKEWHKAFEVPVVDNFKGLDQQRFILRKRLMEEELKELLYALEYDIPEAWAKEMSDLIYVILGTALECGIYKQLTEVFQLVHERNMSKLGVDGKPVKRADGKVLKGPNYKEPEINFNY